MGGEREQVQTRFVKETLLETRNPRQETLLVSGEVGAEMSIIKADVIREAAAAAGVGSLRDDCAMSLAADAEYRLREIVQDALNFKRHARRRKLTTSDMYVMFAASLRLLCYGGNFCWFICFLPFCLLLLLCANSCARWCACIVTFVHVQKLCTAGAERRAALWFFVPRPSGDNNKDSSRRILGLRAGGQRNGFRRDSKGAPAKSAARGDIPRALASNRGCAAADP